MIEAVSINYLAVLASAVVTFVIGALWYSPLLFGNVWATGHNFSEARREELSRGGISTAHIVAFLSFIVTASVLALILGYLQVTTVPMALRTGFLLWLGFQAAIDLMHAMYQGKSLHLYLIDVGYSLVYILVMSVILTLWR